MRSVIQEVQSNISISTEHQHDKNQASFGSKAIIKNTCTPVNR
jgi:hypothetical protein